ncbi:MAG: T9SS type A sorting domain-containing protein [Bacteroidota bacterium]
MNHRILHFYTAIIALLLSVGAALGQGADIPGSITSDENGYVYVAGTSVTSSGQMSIVVIAYDPDGNVWKEFVLPAAAAGAAVVVGVDLIDSLILVAGTAATINGGADMFAAGFDRPTLVSVRSDPSTPLGLRLEQNYPNPLHRGSVATIGYSIPVAGAVHLAVVDFSGREVAVLVDGFHEVGSFQTQFQPSALPSGSYLYVLSSSSTSEVRRLTLIR